MRTLSALWLTTSLIIYCYLIPTWLTSTAMTYLVFNSVRDMQGVAFAASTVLYPILLIFTEYLAWMGFSKDKYEQACMLAAMPALLILFVWGYLYHFTLDFWWPWM